jgi:hypothetical protein
VIASNATILVLIGRLLVRRPREQRSQTPSAAL